MLYILNRNEKIVSSLQKENDRMESNVYFEDAHHLDLSTGAEYLEFSVIANSKVMSDIQVGGYIAKKFGEYDYKLFEIISTEEFDTKEGFYKSVYCEINGLELIGNVYTGSNFNSVNVERFLESLLQDTSWEPGYIDGRLVKTLALKVEEKEVYSILQENIKKFDAEISFRVVIKNNKVVGRYIDAHFHRGSSIPKRLELRRDIEKITRKIDMTKFATKLIGRGKDKLSFKDATITGIDKPLGQNFLINEKAYSTYNLRGRHITRIYEYDTTDPYELLRQTKKALEEYSKINVTYSIDSNITDLKKYNIGDVITINDYKFQPPLLIEARIVQLELSETDYTKNKAVISNVVEVPSGISRFPIVNSDISDGAVSGDKIQNHAIKGTHIVADSIDTKHLKAGSVNADKIEANSIKTIHLSAESITADKLVAGSITADKLAAGSVTADKILAGIIEAKHIKTGTITAGSGVIAEGAIGSALISELTASKLTAGTIDTTDITIMGGNGNLRLRNNRLQVFEGIGLSQFERVSIGDVNGDGSLFGLRVRGSDGQTVLFDERGVTPEGITDGSINNDKINPNANIDGSKLNIGTVIDKINEDGSRTINSIKINVGANDLEAVIREINSKSDEHGKSIETNSSQIRQNASDIKMKVNSTEYKNTVSGINKSIETTNSELKILKGKVELKADTTYVDTATGEISGKISKLTVDVNGVNSKVEDLNGKYTQIKQTVDNIDITGKVSFTDLSRPNNKTHIHGANIISGTISAEDITGGTLRAMDEIIFSDNAYISKIPDGFGGNNGVKISSSKIVLESSEVRCNQNISSPEVYIDRNLFIGPSGNFFKVTPEELHFGYNSVYNQYSKAWVSILTAKGGNVSVGHDIWADHFNSRITGGSIVRTSSIERNKVAPFEIIGKLDVVHNEEGNLKMVTNDVYNDKKIEANPVLSKDDDGETCLDIVSVISAHNVALKELKDEIEKLKNKN